MWNLPIGSAVRNSQSPNVRGQLGTPNKVTKVTEVIPSAKRLIRSLRDIGYDMPSAICDLIDNSIAAQASNVWVDTHFDGDGSWVRIVDDGAGMTAGKLREAMRFGTRRSYGNNDLGRFGLGLKSASLSQCRRLTVATRSSAAGRMNIARWDLDHIEATDRWEVLRPSARDCHEASKALKSRCGTSVLWQRLDRVTRYRLRDGVRAQSSFDQLTGEIQAHLAMTFHRYLSGLTKSKRRLAIHLNGVLVQSWDPFAVGEPETRPLGVQRVNLNHHGARRVVLVRPYILPTEAAFSSAATHRRAAGPRFWKAAGLLHLPKRSTDSGGWMESASDSR